MNIRNQNKHQQFIAMMAISFVIHILSIVKSSVLAANFGAGPELDAYNLSNNLISFIFELFSGGVVTVVLPAFVCKINRKAIDSFLTALWIIIGILLFFIYIFKNSILGLVVRNNDDLIEFTSGVLFYTILVQFLSGILSVTSAYYQASSKFIIPRIIALIANSAVLLTILFVKSFTLIQYVRILLLWTVVQAIVDISLAVKNGYRFNISFGFLSSKTKELFKVFAPSIVSSGVYKIHSLVDSLIATMLVAGSLTVLTYSNAVVTSISGLIIGNMLHIAYPEIVKASSKGTGKGIEKVWEYSVAFHLLICVVIVCFFTGGLELLRLLLGRGKFVEDAVNLTYICSCIYFFGQQANVIRDLIYRYFYSKGDTKTTLKNSTMVSALNIILSLLLVKPLGVYGIALGTVISGFCSLLMIIFRLRRQYGSSALFRINILVLIKTSILATFSIVVVLFIRQIIKIASVILSMAIFSMLSFVIFVLLIYLFNRNSISILRQCFTKNQ